MSLMKRFLVALLISLLAAGVTLVIAQAKSETSAPAQESQPDCLTCHPTSQQAWASGAHGHATTDPIFTRTWDDQGRPGACLVCHVTGYDPAQGTWQKNGVACETCHNPLPANHPEEPMPIDGSTELCGHCHSGARFGWQEWETSTHFQRNMTCTICHDPHSAALKTVEGLEVQGPSSLCVNCHQDYSMDFPYSSHSLSGVQCVDCHLRHFGAPGDRDIHKMPDHSFNASLGSCTACHANQMHDPTQENAAGEASAAAISENEFGSEVSENPMPVSPLGFSGLAALLGLAGGMVLSPWLERFYRKMTQKSKDERQP